MIEIILWSYWWLKSCSLKRVPISFINIPSGVGIAETGQPFQWWPEKKHSTLLGSNHSHLPKHGTVLFNRNGGALSIRALEMLHFLGSLVMSSNCCTFASGQQSLQRSSLFSKCRMILACSPDLSHIFLRSEKWNACNQLTSKCGMNSMNPSRELSKIKIVKMFAIRCFFLNLKPFFREFLSGNLA